MTLMRYTVMCDLINVLAILYGGNLHGEYAVPY